MSILKADLFPVTAVTQRNATIFQKYCMVLSPPRNVMTPRENDTIHSLHGTNYSQQSTDTKPLEFTWASAREPLIFITLTNGLSFANL